MRVLGKFRIARDAPAEFLEISGFEQRLPIGPWKALDPTVSRVLAKCHNERNLAEHERRTEVDETLLGALIESTAKLEKAVSALDPPPAPK